MNTAVIGLQFGDEGKGKIVDFLAQEHDIVARFSGGSNAGHTVIYNDEKIKFHLIPSGVLAGKTGVLGNGMVVDLFKLDREMEMLKDLGIEGRLIISSRAHVVTELHRVLDARDDEILGIGTTRQGIGPAYSAKVRRTGLRMHELNDADAVENKLRMLNELYMLDVSDEELKRMARETVKLGRKYREMIKDTEVWLNDAIRAGKKCAF